MAACAALATGWRGNDEPRLPVKGPWTVTELMMSFVRFLCASHSGGTWYGAISLLDSEAIVPISAAFRNTLHVPSSIQAPGFLFPQRRRVAEGGHEAFGLDPHTRTPVGTGKALDGWMDGWMEVWNLKLEVPWSLVH